MIMVIKSTSMIPIFHTTAIIPLYPQGKPLFKQNPYLSILTVVKYHTLDIIPSGYLT